MRLHTDFGYIAFAYLENIIKIFSNKFSVLNRLKVLHRFRVPKYTRIITIAATFKDIRQSQLIRILLTMLIEECGDHLLCLMKNVKSKLCFVWLEMVRFQVSLKRQKQIVQCMKASQGIWLIFHVCLRKWYNWNLSIFQFIQFN